MEGHLPGRQASKAKPPLQHIGVRSAARIDGVKQALLKVRTPFISVRWNKCSGANHLLRIGSSIALAHYQRAHSDVQLPKSFADTAAQ